MVWCVQPYALNAATLATRGVDTLGGVLLRGLPFDTGLPLANRLLGALTSAHVPNMATCDMRACLPAAVLMLLPRVRSLSDSEALPGCA